MESGVTIWWGPGLVVGVLLVGSCCRKAKTASFSTLPRHKGTEAVQQTQEFQEGPSVGTEGSLIEEEITCPLPSTDLSTAVLEPAAKWHSSLAKASPRLRFASVSQLRQVPMDQSRPWPLRKERATPNTAHNDVWLYLQRHGGHVIDQVTPDGEHTFRYIPPSPEPFNFKALPLSDELSFRRQDLPSFYNLSPPPSRRRVKSGTATSNSSASTMFTAHAATQTDTKTETTPTSSRSLLRRKL